MNALPWNISGDARVVDLQIGVVLKNASNLDQQVQSAACGALVMIMAHGQTTPLKRLFNGLYGTGFNLKALKVWAEEMVPAVMISFDKDTKEVVIKLKDQIGADRFKLQPVDDAVALASTFGPWWKHAKPENPFGEWSLVEKHAALLKEARAMADAKAHGIYRKGKTERHLTDEERAKIDLNGWERIVGGAIPVERVVH